MNEPIAINPDSEVEIDIQFDDRIVKLIDGTTLIGRMLIFTDDIEEDDSLHFHSH